MLVDCLVLVGVEKVGVPTPAAPRIARVLVDPIELGRAARSAAVSNIWTPFVLSRIPAQPAQAPVARSSFLRSQDATGRSPRWKRTRRSRSSSRRRPH